RPLASFARPDSRGRLSPHNLPYTFPFWAGFDGARKCENAPLALGQWHISTAANRNPIHIDLDVPQCDPPKLFTSKGKFLRRASLKWNSVCIVRKVKKVYYVNRVSG